MVGLKESFFLQFQGFPWQVGWFGEWNFVRRSRVDCNRVEWRDSFLHLISMRTSLNICSSRSYALDLSNEKVSIWGLDRIFCLSMQESCACINLQVFLFWWTWFFDWKVRTFAIFVAIIWFYLQSKSRKITCSMSEISWTCCAYWYMLTYVRYLLPNLCEVWMGMGDYHANHSYMNLIHINDHMSLLYMYVFMHNNIYMMLYI